VKVLFLLIGSARHFESVIEGLGSRGHDVHLAMRGPTPRCEELIDRIGERYPGVTRGVPPMRADPWVALSEAVGLGRDYLRFLSPEYADATKLRARAERQAPGKLVRPTRWPLVRSRLGIWLLGAGLQALERNVPDGPEISGYVRGERPDLLIVSPLVRTTSQAHFVRAARSLGIRSALLVRSWDNLTNRGLIRELPDCVYVWNEDQRREATELHGVPEERVVVTGAYQWDHWFEWKPSTSPELFRERLGLAPERPTLLYACSSAFVAHDERPLVKRWLRTLREHPDERLRNANVHIRPYPSNREAWRDSPLAHEPGVAIWPLDEARQGRYADHEGRSAYFDSIYHSSAVVGLNTTTMLEAALVGRPVFTVLDREYRDSQQGLPHFQYLRRDNGGPVTLANTFTEHFAQLAQALAGATATEDADREFVRRFLRPHGLDRPALPVLIDALEDQMAAAPPRAAPVRRPIVQAVLRPLAALTAWSVGGPASDRPRPAVPAVDH
jgi:hypothetical protein